jgi:transcriptional regulator with XRE-family HTH domain
MTDTEHGNEALGRYVRDRRRRLGYSLRQTAAMAGLDPSYLSRLERGRYASPDPRQLRELARVLEVESADLHQRAGYSDGLPAVTPYLRAKYGLPEGVIAQVAEYVELLNERYGRQDEEGDDDGHDSRAA